MEQLTKPELLNGEKVVNVQLSNQDIKFIHEALVFALRDKIKNSQESSTIGMTKLREEFNKIRILLNPS